MYGKPNATMAALIYGGGYNARSEALNWTGSRSQAFDNAPGKRHGPCVFLQ